MIYILDNGQPYSSHAVYFIEDALGDYVDQSDVILEIANMMFTVYSDRAPRILGSVDYIDWREKGATTDLRTLISENWWKFEPDDIEKLSPKARELVLQALKPHQKELQGLREYR